MPFKSTIHNPQSAFTLVELIIGAAMLTIAITALLGAFLGQVTLNEHARNLTWAVNDANRVMERLRQLNTGACPNNAPSAVPPLGTSWNAWLADTTPAGGGGKSIQPSPNVDERIIVTCVRNGAPTPPLNPDDYCGNDGGGAGADQSGTGEWRVDPTPSATAFDPIRLTVAVCWRHRNRTLGECRWDGVNLIADSASDANGNGVIESTAMLSTLMTCRQ